MSNVRARAYACCEHCEDCDPNDLHLWHGDPCHVEGCSGAVDAVDALLRTGEVPSDGQ